MNDWMLLRPPGKPWVGVPGLVMFLVIVSFETSGTCDGGSDIGAVKTNYCCGHSFQKSCYRSNVVKSKCFEFTFKIQTSSFEFGIIEMVLDDWMSRLTLFFFLCISKWNGLSDEVNRRGKVIGSRKIVFYSEVKLADDWKFKELMDILY